MWWLIGGLAWLVLVGFLVWFVGFNKFDKN